MVRIFFFQRFLATLREACSAIRLVRVPISDSPVLQVFSLPILGVRLLSCWSNRALELLDLHVRFDQEGEGRTSLDLMASDTKTYRAIVQRGYNPEDPESTFELVEKPIPSAGPGKVVVHITLRPINPYDLNLLRFGLLAAKHSFPVTTGSEGFGIVHSVGEGVTTVKPGQRVIPLTAEALDEGNGSWQEYISLREEFVVPVPDKISDEAAAQFVVNPWTVIGLLRDIGVPKGEYLLVTAAGSVLGRQIIQLGKHKGIKTISLIRRPEQKEELKALGADEVIVYTSEDVVSRVKEITGNKLASGAVDCVGGDVTKRVASSVRGGGNVFVYGTLGSWDAIVGIVDLFRGVKVQGWALTDDWLFPEKRKSYIKEALEYIESKVIEPLAGEKFDLAQFKEAIKKSEEVGRGGKVLLVS
ncbi:hypothetical protein R1sor_012716 [Riccia sorocarpa]|uniref:Enoyl reductase (ER) domain-containing protein n=1 Tax=Riccia sorocarpa TaxID=122646 RepID=A0ABD3I4K1_9MARC